MCVVPSHMSTVKHSLNLSCPKYTSISENIIEIITYFFGKTLLTYAESVTWISSTGKLRKPGFTSLKIACKTVWANMAEKTCDRETVKLLRAHFKITSLSRSLEHPPPP